MSKKECIGTLFNLTHQGRLRKSIRWRLLRKLWVWNGNLSRWAGNKMLALSRIADEKDWKGTTRADTRPDRGGEG